MSYSTFANGEGLDSVRTKINAVIEGVNIIEPAVLGLGTAAQANVTASATDTTAGRLLKVGDYGLGSYIAIPSGTDLNAITVGGFYAIDAPVNGPPLSSTSGGTLMVIGGANVTEQVFYDYNTKRKHHRGRLFSAWSPWRLIHDELTADNSAWVTPTLQNGWSDSGGIDAVKYTKRAGVVSIQGAIQGGATSAGTRLFTLPVGFRPASNSEFFGRSGLFSVSAAPVGLFVTTGGGVIIDFGGASPIAFGITFAAGN